MDRAVIFFAAVVCLRCGGSETAYRPLAIDVQNVSSLAETLVLKISDVSDRACDGITLTNVSTFQATHTATWTRGSGALRELEAPSVDSEQVLVVVYTEDGGGAAIQLACTEVRFADIETSRITLRLGATLAHILDAWWTRSARSSLRGSLGLEAWPRSSLRIDATTRAARRWSSNVSAPISPAIKNT